jgi:hypothetical protein
VPAREAHCWNVKVGKSNARSLIAVFGRETKGVNIEARLEALLHDEPLRRAVLFRERPSIESCHHQRFVLRKINHGADAEGGD